VCSNVCRCHQAILWDLSHYAVVNETIVKLYYNIRVKDHNSIDWALVTPNLAPSTTGYTTVKFGLASTNPDPGGWSIWIGNITKSDKVDIQVLGINGFYTKLIDNPSCWRIPQFSVFNETGRSAWSSTQTITILPVKPHNPQLQLPSSTFVIPLESKCYDH
jgi:hypothetical protein